jgi:hypothetical protein
VGHPKGVNDLPSVLMIMRRGGRAARVRAWCGARRASP